MIKCTAFTNSIKKDIMGVSKKINFLAFLLVGFATFSFAQQKAVKTVVIKTPTVQCESCKKRIENYMSHEEGIQKVNVDFKKKTTTVVYLTDRTNPENIKALIANVGYDADDVTAEPDAYKRLPTCCKKPEDGGGGEKKN
ncbi:heavy metal-associated domain-containing protein [Flavitalea sp. BT771]|uniref:heavy-metal-associated domain-containing protein n=1 Tax=Flavitalea sp. BT771 TaxID=3063329 RepID=UPI0026E2F3AC|nr:heavy metal-associated domain-containing protein [Flavitalea sp. BT771]MDO6435277.1 heavy metal-associated domain-containing protein [Flavitalea sp. BT771]MDV6224018.1 heavy metal-associated domain-containing protein [Flavitalea sp. BT771]